MAGELLLLLVNYSGEPFFRFSGNEGHDGDSLTGNQTNQNGF